MIFPKDKPYYSYGQYLKNLFGCRVYKVSIDAGFSCPNRDGSKGVGGCTFCDETGSSSYTHCLDVSIKDQILNNINTRRTLYHAKKFIAYFQSHTNTHAPVSELKKAYDEALNAHPDIVGLAISTRPDCVDEEKLALIASYRDRVPYVLIEYGMQTMHDKTLKKINRCSCHDDFLRAMELTDKFRLNHCIHVILGLPGEDRDHMMQTANTLAEMNVQGVKIHLLVAMKNTPLAKSYLRKEWSPLTFEEYISLTCDFIERLPPTCVIHRLSENGHPQHILAPEFMTQRKKSVLKAVTATLIERGSYQGLKDY